MKSMELSDKSGAVPNVETLSPSQVEEVRALLDSMDAWLSNDEGLMTEDIIEWREMLAKPLGVAPQSWFERTRKSEN